jgi:MFS family permease
MATDAEVNQNTKIGSATNLSALLAVISSSIMIESIDGSIVTIALPKMAIDLSSGISLLSWVATAYLVANAAMVVQAGKMADLFSMKKIFLIGLGVFGLSSALVGLSPNVYSAIVFRVIQGLSSTFLVATGYPMIFAYFPPKRAASAIGISSAAWAAGAVAGPVLGGFLVALNWRLIFFINVPIAILVELVGLKVIPKGEKNPKKKNDIERTSTLKQLNIQSSVVLAFTITTALMWLTLFNFVYAVLAVAGMVIFVLTEIKSSNPLISRVLLHNRGFMLLVIGGGIITEVPVGGTIYGMSYYFQTVLNFPPEVAGALIASLPIAVIIASVIAGRIYGKVERPALISFFGILVMGITLTGLFFLLRSGSPSLWELILLLYINGTAQGFWWVLTLTGILKFAQTEMKGIANGVANMFLSIGFAVGIALTTIVSSVYLSPDLVSKIFLGNLSNLTLSDATAFGDGIGLAMLVGAVVAFFSLPFYSVAAREQRRKSSDIVEKV